MTAPHPLGQAIAETRRRIGQATFWHAFSTWAGTGLLAAGAVVLLGKLTAPAIVVVGLAAAGAVLLAALVAGARARHAFTPADAAVLVDRRGKLEGLPLLYLAYPDSEWIGRAPANGRSALPEIDPRPFVKRILPGLLFLGGVSFVPQQENFGAMLPRPHVAALREVQRLTEKIEKLEEKKLLPEKETERLRQELQKLEETAKSRAFSPEAWEGVDHLAEQMQQASRERSAQLSTAASAASSLSDALSAGEVESALKMEQSAAALRALQGVPNRNLPADLQKLLQSLGNPSELEKMDPKALQDALQDLKDFLDKERQELADSIHDHGPGG